MSTDNIGRRTFLGHAAGAVAGLSLVPEALPRPLRVTGAPLPVGVIGVGRQGRRILTELQRMDAVRVAAVCDTDRARLDAGLRRTQGAQGFDDHRAMLEKGGVEAVFVATPTHLHREIVEQAVEAERHVYCEAPLASTIEDAAAIGRAARASRKVFRAGLEGRSNPIYQLARTFFLSDAVRDLISMRAQFHQKTSWRIPVRDPEREREFNWKLDGGISIGLPGEEGTHQFDVFHWYTGRYPESIRGGGSIRLWDDGRDVFDTVACELLWPGGARLVYEATLCNSFQGRHEVLHGSNAAIKLAWNAGWMFKEADAPTQGWEVYANRQQFHNDEGITLIADATQLAAQGRLQDGVGLPNSPLYYAVEEFLKGIVEGGEITAGAGDAYRSTVIGILANRAAVTGETVKVDEAVLRG